MIYQLDVPDSINISSLIRAIKTEANRQGFHLTGNYAGEPRIEIRAGRIEDLVRDLEQSISLFNEHPNVTPMRRKVAP